VKLIILRAGVCLCSTHSSQTAYNENGSINDHQYKTSKISISHTQPSGNHLSHPQETVHKSKADQVSHTNKIFMFMKYSYGIIQGAILILVSYHFLSPYH